MGTGRLGARGRAGEGPLLAGQGIPHGSSHNPVPVHGPLAPVGPCKLQTDLGGQNQKKSLQTTPCTL